MNRLKELRQDKGLTQVDFAKDIGIPYRTIQRWENGKSQIKPEKAQQLADYFGVSVGYLLGYEDWYTIEKDAIKKSKTIQDFLKNNPEYKDFLNTFENYLLSSGKFAFSMFEDTEKMVIFEERLKQLIIEDYNEGGGDPNDVSETGLNSAVENTYIALSYLPIIFQEFFTFFLTLSNSDKKMIVNLVERLHTTDQQKND